MQRFATRALGLLSLAVLGACGGGGGAAVSAKDTSTTTSTAANSQSVTIVGTNLADGQVVRIVAKGFTPKEPLGVVECGDRGKATGMGDCDIAHITSVTSDGHGIVSARMTVRKGPFGAANVVCSATQACLLSVTQLSLTPFESAATPIPFG